jgi:hypothetical protein
MYLFEKGIMFLRNQTLMRMHRRWPGVADFSQLTRVPTSVGIDMSNPLHVHIGDQLFLEPAIRACRDRGVAVVVAPTPSMRQYFAAAGYQIASPEEVLRQELRLAPTWMYDFIPPRERRRRFVYLNTTDHRIRRPVSTHLAECVIELLGLVPSAMPLDGRPFLPPANSALLNARSGRWIAFNDAVDSGAFRISSKDVARLWTIAAERQREGHSIVRVGSEGERMRAPAALPFDHLDARGQTDVVGLFSLLGRPEIESTLSFDTAVAHIALAYGKRAEILMRRFSPAHAEFVRKFIIPSYETAVPADITYL